MRYDKLRDEWSRELRSLGESLNKYPMAFPDTCVYEFTHALMHIVSGYRYAAADRGYPLHSACAHIRRTHLDYLKIIISHIHNHLQKDPASLNTLNFLKAKIAARLDEFDNIGGSHENTVRDFRSIIDDYLHYLPADFSFPGSPESIVAGRKLEDKVNSVSSDTAKPASLMTGSAKELEEWARLESILISLRGKKLYHVSFSLMNIFIEYVDMKKKLTEQIVAFKLEIIDVARDFDHDGALGRKLDNSRAYTDIITPAKAGLKSSDLAEQDEAFQRITQNIDEPFSLVKEFLGFYQREARTTNQPWSSSVSGR
jgi:hypothetical protein